MERMQESPYLFRKHNNKIPLGGTGRKQWGMMGSGTSGGTRLYRFGLIRPGNCWERERHPLLEQPASLTPAGSAGWGGLDWHDVSSAINLPHRRPHHQNPIWLSPSTNIILELIFLSLQAGSLPSQSCSQKLTSQPWSQPLVSHRH